LCRKEDLLFKDPLWIFGALCGGYLPHVLPTTSTLKTLKTIRETIASLSQQDEHFSMISHICNIPRENDKTKSQIPRVMVATIAPSYDTQPESEEIQKLGLSCRRAYIISDTRPCRGDTVLHLKAWNAK
jgi:hypothetical protein